MLPTTRVTFRGHRVSARIRAMLKAAEQVAGLPVQIAQGSYMGAGGAAASAGTHGAEAVDLRVRHLTTAQRVKLVRALKDVGFAAWFRPEIPGLWGPHIHALPIGGDLDPLARAQVYSFDRGRNGLRGDALDRTYRPEPKVRWDFVQARPVRRR